MWLITNFGDLIFICLYVKCCLLEKTLLPEIVMANEDALNG